MVAVRTGFPSPMQPMRGFPSAALPAGQTPVPAPMPPMPLAGFPPPPVKPPMAQQFSNAPRRRRFGDSLEGMLGRNIFATQQQQPMPTPMMPRPMEMGGAVQYFANGGNANRQAAESMLAAGIGNVGGKAITSEAQDIQDRFSGLANRRSRRRRKRRERRAREEAARLAAEQAALESERLLLDDVGNFNRASNVLIEPPSGVGAAALPIGGPGTFPPAAPPPASTELAPPVGPEVGYFGDTVRIDEGKVVPPDPFIPRSIAPKADEINLLDPISPSVSGIQPISSTDYPDMSMPITPGVTAPIGYYNDPMNIYYRSESDERELLDEGVRPLISSTDDPSTITYRLSAAYAQRDPVIKQMMMDQIENTFGTDAMREAESNLTYKFKDLGLKTGDVNPITGKPFETSVKDFGFKTSNVGRQTPINIDYRDMSKEGIGKELGSDYQKIIDFRNSGLGDDIQPEIISFPRSSFGQVDLGRPGDRGFTPSGTQIAPEAATTFGMTPEEQGIVGGMSAVPTAGSAVTPEELNIMSGMSAVPDAGQKIAPPKAGTGGSDRDDKSRPRLTPEELESLKASLGEQVPISGIEKVINQVIGKAFFGLGSGFADKLKASSEAERQAIVDQHLNALNSGATPVYNDKGEYIGFNMNTMDTFADKVLAADDISVFLPGGPADADGDGVIDYDRFQQVFDAQSTAADADRFGQSTEQGFITSDGREFFVDATGNVVEVKDGVVPFEVGGGDDVVDIFSTTTKDDGGDSGSDTGVDTGHTVDEDGNIVCNTEGYVYNPETKVCEPAKEEEDDGTPGSGIGTGTSGESFEDVLKRVVVAAPDVAPISANVRPMQEGGMAGLNRAADNFLKALAG